MCVCVCVCVCVVRDREISREVEESYFVSYINKDDSEIKT